MTGQGLDKRVMMDILVDKKEGGGSSTCQGRPPLPVELEISMVRLSQAPNWSEMCRGGGVDGGRRGGVWL